MGNELKGILREVTSKAEQAVGDVGARNDDKNQEAWTLNDTV